MFVNFAVSTNNSIYIADRTVKYKSTKIQVKTYTVGAQNGL